MHAQYTNVRLQRKLSVLKDDVTLRNVFDVLVLYLFGATSSKLITLGVTFLMTGIPGFWDFITYGFDSLNGMNSAKPAPAFQWPQYFGALCFITGVFIKYTNYQRKVGNKLREERTKFKETYLKLSDERLQDEFERLYGVKNADIRAIKNILSHPDNKNLVIALFEKAHLNIEPFDDWFVAKGKLTKLRYNVGFLIWIGLPLLAVAILIMCVLEYFYPGITSSGQYVIYAYGVLLIAITVGTITTFQELKSLGHAITLVDKHKPRINLISKG